MSSSRLPHPDVKEGARVDIQPNMETRQHWRRHDGACENSPGPKNPLRKRVLLEGAASALKSPPALPRVLLHSDAPLAGEG